MNVSGRARKGVFFGLFLMGVMLAGLAVAAYLLIASMIEQLFREFELPSVIFQQTAEHNEFVPRRHSTELPFVSMPATDIVDTGYMVLVNRDNAFTAETPGNMVSAWPAVPVSQVNDMYLHPTALSALEALFDAARAAQIGTLFLSSGFRDVEAQRAVYNSGIGREFVLPPGHSEHHTGLAVDIMAVDIGQWELAGSAQGHWLENNAYRFGFILRYPQGAEGITGVAYEPWHFRYVGEVHAYYMRRHNLVLEEYIAVLQAEGHISFEKDGVKYHILYKLPENDTLQVPGLSGMIISSSNLGGYIVKAW